MRMKLIAAVVAGLFTSGSAIAQDYFGGFVWQGSATVGGRGTNTDGGTRNGAVATSSATLVPYQGPEDVAKAQEYQDTQSGVIGFIDMIGGSRGYYLRGFGENFGRDDQYINVVGGGYNSWKAQIYSDNLPHNLSFNALTPLQNSGTAFMPNPGTPPYPPARNPGRLEHVQLQRPARHGRRQHRGVRGHALLHPRRLQRSHDDRHAARERAARHGLGQRPDRIRHPHRFHDEEHDDRRGLRREVVERQAAVP